MKAKISNLLKYGISSYLAKELIFKGLNVTTIKNTSIKNICHQYGIDMIIAKEIKNLTKRHPINKEVLDDLLLNNNFTCCCCTGDKGQSIIVHHINEYEKSQDNSYNNLAVLCPTCHDLVHSSRALTLTISKDQLIKSKLSWEKRCVNRRNEIEKLIKEPIIESYGSNFSVYIEEGVISEYNFDLCLSEYDNEIYGYFTMTYLNRGNMFLAGEFKHEPNSVDVDVEISYWDMQWGMRVSEKQIFKAIINYGFGNEVHMIILDSTFDLIPYSITLEKYDNY